MEPQNRDVGRKLFLFTIAMFTIPVIVFFAVRTHVFGADNPKTDMWSGFVAVFVVNVIIAAYIVMAFMEDKDEQPAGGGRAPRPGVAGSKERTD